MVGINLADPTYTTAINSGTDAWQLTQNAWQLSKDGYQAKTTVYKTSVDLWRDNNGNWSTTDNGGIKIDKNSYVNEAKAATADTAATTIAKDNFVAGATVAAGYKVDYNGNYLSMSGHGMSSGDAITFHTNPPGGTTAGTTYYVYDAGSDNLTLHTTEAAAKAGTGAINLSRMGAEKAPLTDVSVALDTTVAHTIAGGTSAAGNATLTMGAAHGLANGTAIKLSGLHGSESNYNNTTVYYVKNAGTPNATMTLYTDKALTTAAGNFSHADTSTSVNVLGDTFTQTSGHGYETGDKVVFNGTTPAGLADGTSYYVRKTATNDFLLYDTAVNAAAGTHTGLKDITTATSGLTTEANMVKGSIDVVQDKINKVAHGLSSGTKVEITTTIGDPEKPATTNWILANPAYVKYLTADSYELYSSAADANGNFTAGDKIVFGDLTNPAADSFRMSVEESASRVIINDKGNALKKGMFLTTNPGTSGEDASAIAAKFGDVVSINKTTQDISTFATELNTDYDDVNLKSVESSQIALTLVKLAITQVATDRAKLGAVQSRLNFTNEQLTVTKENLSAAISRIADVDVAEEATNYARYQILVASGTEMLKQANQLPQSALQLLR